MERRFWSTLGRMVKMAYLCDTPSLCGGAGECRKPPAAWQFPESEGCIAARATKKRQKARGWALRLRNRICGRDVICERLHGKHGGPATAPGPPCLATGRHRPEPACGESPSKWRTPWPSTRRWLLRPERCSRPGRSARCWPVDIEREAPLRPGELVLPPSGHGGLPPAGWDLRGEAR